MTSSVTQLLCSCQFLLGAREVIPEFVSVFRTCADKHCLASYPIFFLEGMKLCSWTTVCISAGGKCRICLRQFGFCMALLVSCGTSSLATLTSRIPGLTSGRYRPSIYVAWKIWKKKLLRQNPKMFSQRYVVISCSHGHDLSERPYPENRFHSSTVARF